MRREPLTPDQAIARLSRKQHGVWSRRQALARSVTPKMIRGRLAHGSWIRLDVGVYAHAAAPPTWERSIMAAVLAEPWAVASHRCGAVLHVVSGFRPGRPEITVRPGANVRGRLAIAHRGVDIRTTMVRGIPTARIEQVFIDLAQVVSFERLSRSLAATAESNPRLLDAVRDRYCELAPRGGRDLRGLRAALEQHGVGPLHSGSELERRMEEALADIAVLEREAVFPGRSPGPQRVDALIRRWRLVIEADGRAWHARVEDFERDRRRDAEAAAAGYQTLRFTWHQLVNDRRWVRRIVLETGAQRERLVVGGPAGPLWTPVAPNVNAA